MQTASKNLMDTLTEVYEPQWTGQDLLTVQGQNSEMLWADLAHKLSDQAWITQLPGLQTRDVEAGWVVITHPLFYLPFIEK